MRLRPQLIGAFAQHPEFPVAHAVALRKMALQSPQPARYRHNGPLSPQARALAEEIAARRVTREMYEHTIPLPPTHADSGGEGTTTIEAAAGKVGSP